MKSITAIITCATVGGIVTILCASTALEKSLGDNLLESKWDRIIGSWVDPETKGQITKNTYTWKFKDRVILVTSKTHDLEGIAIIGKDSEGTIYQMGADNQGTSHLGKWRLADGVAILELGFSTEQGVKGGMRASHHLKDDNTLIITIEGLTPKPFTSTLVRDKK